MESTKHCPHCGTAVSPTASVCPGCGQELVERKFCPHCGERIDADCVVCPHCGKQASTQTAAPQINIVNNATSSASASAQATISAPAYQGKRCSKWTAFFLCLFLGWLGAHKFYEGKIGMGILYLCTVGLCGFGWIIDTFAILFKPNPYYI